MQPTPNAANCRVAELAIGAPVVGFDQRAVPIEPGNSLESDAVLSLVGAVLGVVPFELHRLIITTIYFSGQHFCSYNLMSGGGMLGGLARAFDNGPTLTVMAFSEDGFFAHSFSRDV